MEFNFSGYATKHNIKCTDGRVIMADAFQHQDGASVPLVWQHKHDDSKNVLGHAILEHREDGVYAYGIFNDTPSGKNTKELVKHGDISSLSIYANKLVQEGADVKHGEIKEVSLVFAGANPEAFIDNVVLEHSDGTKETLDTEAIIFSGDIMSTESGIIEHADADDKGVKTILDMIGDENISIDDLSKAIQHADKKSADKNLDELEMTIQEIFDTLSPTQKRVVYYMVGQVMDKSNGFNHADGGKETMKKNIFEGKETDDARTVLSHADVKSIMSDAQSMGSLNKAIEKHALAHSITNIDILFPDAQLVGKNPDLLKRRTEWVTKVLGGTKKSPFNRIKTIYADLTPDEARAKGYVTGNEKAEEIIGLFKRETLPQTVYKKQALDRDDIIDIVDLDVVAFLKAEMRLMLDEEIARAVLIGDGRTIGEDDKIKEDKIRPIYSDADLYSHHQAKLPVDATVEDIIDEMLRARNNYKGSGMPSLYVSPNNLTDMLLLKDADGHRMYKTLQELAAAIRVKEIVEVEVMNALERTEITGDLDDLLCKGIIVNLVDYTLGANKGGKVSMFDDFDIDFNKHKYLIETRLCGALTRPKSALVIEMIKPVA
jgi:HK97 family phage prohead protease